MKIYANKSIYLHFNVNVSIKTIYILKKIRKYFVYRIIVIFLVAT